MRESASDRKHRHSRPREKGGAASASAESAHTAGPAAAAPGLCLSQAEAERATIAAIVDSFEDAIIAHSLKGIVVAWNQAAERLYGYTAAEMVGEPVSRLVPPERQAEQRGLMRRVKRGERVEQFETVRVRKEGQRVSVSLTLAPMRDASGQVIGASVVARDVTARTQAQAEVQRLSRQNALILEAAGEGIYGVDLQGRTTFSNPAAARMIGWEIPELLGRRQHEVLHHSRADGSPYPAEQCPIYAALRDGGVHRVENDVFWRKDGTSFPVRYVSTPLREADGTIVGAVVVFEDISERQRAEEFIRLLVSAVDQIDESVLITDAQLDRPGPVVVYANPAFTKMTGYSIDEILGKTPRILQGPKTDRAVLDRLRDDLTHGRVFHGETINYRKDGSEFVLEWRIAPIRDNEGRTTHFVAVQRDITEQKREEAERERLLETVDEERRRLEAVINQMPEGVVLVDAQARITTYNAVARAMAAVEPAEAGVVDGRVLFDVRKPDGEPARWEELPPARAVREGVTTVGEEYAVRRADGQIVPVLASGAPVVGPDGELMGAVAVFQDITPLKELERLREEWTSVIAHDLRQPVAIITGYASLLVKLAAQPGVPAPARSAATHILASAHQLNRMIEDLLDMSRIEAGRLRLELRPIDVPEFVRTVVDRLSAITQEHPVIVHVCGSVPSIEADPGRLEQALGNLLSNAAKYGYEGTEIQVRIEQRASDVVVTVTNQGPGIATEDLPKLFSRFHRTQRAQAEKVPGLGLGLYISQGIIRAHGGRIWVESTPGETTSFSFTLPIRQRASRNAADINSSSTATARSDKRGRSFTGACG